MRHNKLRPAAILLAVAVVAGAHDGPVQLPPPATEAEAWNVLRLASANVDELLPANLPRDAAAQLANIAIALPTLKTNAERSGGVDTLAAQTLVVLDALDGPNAAAAWRDWQAKRSALEKLFPAGTVRADVYVCPMHPQERHFKSTDTCDRCGMDLVVRRLPASAVYQTPGEPTLTMTVRGGPLRVGRQANVVVRLTHADGRPVTPGDLAVVHTQPIHLLINDARLSDYHHEHPKPTNVAGEYAFSFTPQMPGPYRVWADVTPAASGVQEYDIADLAADSARGAIADRTPSLSATVDGRRFVLSFETNGGSLRAGETVVGTMSVTDADGHGFNKLEPVMGAFAHLVGFHEDGRGVLHIHPYGKTPTGPDDRAGPAFAFKFYAPTSGLLRLYGQVQIDGRQVFAPFTLQIAPPAQPATRPRTAGPADSPSGAKFRLNSVATGR